MCLTFIAFAATSFAADPLTIGDPAPPLALKAFLKGEPIKELKKGTVYVIEFSGTQCAPCVKAMPILSDLQQKYPKVPIISVYAEDVDVVRQYVTKYAEKMGFSVAADENDSMFKTWMAAAIMGGIPTAFIVNRESQIAWIGSPFEMAKPLDEIVAGTYDQPLAKIRMRFEQAKKLESKVIYDQMQHQNENNAKALEHIQKKEFKHAVAILDKAVLENRDWEFSFYRIKMMALLSDPDAGEITNQFVASLYGKVSATRFDVSPVIPNLHEYCFSYALYLIEGNRKKPNRFLLEAAEQFILRGEEQLKYMKEDSEYSKEKKYYANRDHKQCRVELAGERKEWDLAIRFQKEYIELIRNDVYLKNYVAKTDQEWSEYQTKRIKTEEGKLAKFAKENEAKSKFKK